MNPTNLILSVSAEIISDEIRNFKRMMVDTFGSKYGVYSHFTLLMMPCNPAKIDESMDLLIDYLKEFNEPLELLVDEVSHDIKGRFISIEFVKDEKVVNLHNKLLELGNTHREDYARPKDIEKMESGNFNDQEIKLMKTFGYHRIAENFRPHITLGSFEEDFSDEQINDTLKAAQEKFSELGSVKLDYLDVKVIESHDNQLDNKVVKADRVEFV